MILPPSDSDLERQPRLIDKPPLRDDTNFAAGKIAIFQYSSVAVFLILIAGFWNLQVKSTALYDERALANSIKSTPLIAPRGRILDRDGRVIVDNHASFKLLLARQSYKEEHMRAIAAGLDIDYDDLMSKVRRFRSRPQYERMVLKEEMTPADLAFVDSHRDFFPELLVVQAQSRQYPQNGMLAHVIGYTGEISEDELDDPQFAKYDPGQIIGKSGIERQYNDWLTGVDGQSQVLVDHLGTVHQTLATKPAVPGKDLQLTIDLDLQAVAELSMDSPLHEPEINVERKNGAVVAMDPNTGEILAMVSRPTFDPNRFIGHIKSKDWDEINKNPEHPLINRAIQDAQSPGSTFKPIMALAALETGTIDDTFTAHCAGGATFYGRFYKCHATHGTIGLHRAIADSCDVYFYTVGNKMGIDNIAYYADLIGYGKPTGIDLPQETKGLVPSSAWAMRTQHHKWYAGDTISVSIGQGELTVTPLQLAHAFAGLSVGGVWRRPHLTREGAANDQPVTWPLDAKNVKDVISGMYGVVNEGGTGVRGKLPGIDVCGKTGTSQVASNEFVKAHGHEGNYLDNAWFVAFAPCEKPEIVVAAMFEHGKESKFAAPIVRDVMKAYFDKKARVAMLEQQKNALTSSLASVSTLGLVGVTGPRQPQAPVARENSPVTPPGADR